MFSTEKVKAYIQKVTLRADGTKRIAAITFYITPITYELAYEIAPQVADRLFRGDGEDALPSQEISTVNFAVTPKKQCMEFVRDPNYAGSRAILQSVEIRKIHAMKLFPDNPDFTLAFDASLEIVDKGVKSILSEVIDLLREEVWLTFSPMQETLLFEDKPVLQMACRLCGMESPEWGTTDGKFAYCQKDMINKQEGEQLERIRDTKKASAEADDLTEAKGDEDPLLDGGPDAAFINERNKGRRKTRSNGADTPRGYASN